MPYLVDAWKSCDKRFSEVRSYISSSSALVPSGQTGYRAELYGSWVLMTYGACQYSLGQIGNACMRVLAERARRPRDLLDRPQIEHYRLTLSEVQRTMLEGSSPSRVDAALRNLVSGSWSESSQLLRIDRNVWPSYIREWMGRIGVSGAAVRWMDQPIPGGTETYASRMTALVAERNPIAHGELVVQVLDSTLMVDWLEDCRLFIERCALTLIEHLVTAYRPRLTRIGTIDQAVRLGNQTIALARVARHVEVGDHVVLKLRDSVRAARVRSIMANDVALDYAREGSLRVAVTLTRQHDRHGLYLAP